MLGLDILSVVMPRMIVVCMIVICMIVVRMFMVRVSIHSRTLTG